MMKKKFDNQGHSIRVECGDLFAVIQRESKSGVHGITFSEPMPVRVADLLNKSGIVDVQSWKKDGTLTFRKIRTFDMDTFMEVVMDILDKQIGYE